MKCHFCIDKATSIYNEEYLCERHYKILYLKTEHKRPTRLVPKSRLESKLKKKYMELISRPQTPEQFNKIVEDFKRDVEIIKKENKIYHKHTY
jgi:hypothetical protein